MATRVRVLRTYSVKSNHQYPLSGKCSKCGASLLGGYTAWAQWQEIPADKSRSGKAVRNRVKHGYLCHKCGKSLRYRIVPNALLLE